MKKNILIFFMLIGYSAFSTTWTVDNNSGAGAQFSAIQAAHDTASAGDTLLIKGSPVSYGSLTIRKELHLIGEGLKPNKNQFAERTTIQRLTIGRSATENPSNTTLSGIYVSSSVLGHISLIITGFSGSEPLSGLGFFRCFFDQTVRVNSHTPGATFSQCIFNSTFSFLGQSPGSSWVVLNSFLTGVGAYIGGSTAGGSRLFKNCVFYGTGSGQAPTGRSITFENNIFYGYAANNPSASFANSVFTNNLCFGNPDNSFPTVNGNVSNNNISGSDPQFVSASLPAFPFNFNNDWNLQTSSPGKNYGTDGTDIGIYGGSGFVNGGATGSGFQTAPMPAIPQMLELNIQNPIVPENGNLNVKVVGRKQQ